MLRPGFFFARVGRVPIQPSMSRTAAEINAELVLVNAAIDRLLGGGVEEFSLHGGDAAVMLKLQSLREHRAALERDLARLTRGTRARFVRGQRF